MWERKSLSGLSEIAEERGYLRGKTRKLTRNNAEGRRRNNPAPVIAIPLFFAKNMFW